MSEVKEKRQPIKPGDVVRCFSGKNKFFGKVVATETLSQGWGSTKKYWVEVPSEVDRRKLPAWRDVSLGSHQRFSQKQYTGSTFNKEAYYISMDSGVAKRVSPIDIAVFNMKNEIYGVPKPKEPKKKKETVEVDGEWHGTDANGWTS